MPKVIISDTSCLILLNKIDSLHLLHQLFDTIIITPEVAKEFGLQLPFWIEIHATSFLTEQQEFEMILDKGESSAIALALELKNCLLIIDELKGRRFAQQHGISVIGTLGIIINAKLKVYLPSVKPILTAIKRTNFRLTEQLERIVLKEAGEQ